MDVDAWDRINEDAPYGRTKDDGAEAPWTFLGVVAPMILLGIVETVIAIACSYSFLLGWWRQQDCGMALGEWSCALNLWSYRCGTKCYVFLRMGCCGWWRKNYDHSEMAHLVNIGQHWPTSTLLCPELDTITWCTRWCHLGTNTRLHKESTEPKFGMRHPVVSKLWTSGACLNSVDFAEFITVDLVTVNVINIIY